MQSVKRITILILALCSLTFISCKTEKEKSEDEMRAVVEKWLMRQLNDPDSYQFVSIMVTTITYGNDMNVYQQELIRQHGETKFRHIQQEIQESSDELAVVRRALGEAQNTPIGFNCVALRYRSTNEYGAKVIKTKHFMVGTGEYKGVLNVRDTRQELYSYPLMTMEDYRRLIGEVNAKK